jgi:hypothetical protein
VALLLLPLLPMRALGLTGAETRSNRQTGQAVSAEGRPANAKLPRVTIQAARERALRLKAGQLVTSVIVQPLDQAEIGIVDGQAHCAVAGGPFCRPTSFPGDPLVKN